MSVRRDRAPYFIPHATTEGIDFILRDVDDSTTSEDGDIINLTGLTVTLEAWDRTGAAKTFPGTVSVVSPGTDGKVRYLPADEDDFDSYATEAPYYVRWKVSDGTTHFFVPNGEDRDRWDIDV